MSLRKWFHLRTKRRRTLLFVLLFYLPAVLVIVAGWYVWTKGYINIYCLDRELGVTQCPNIEFDFDYHSCCMPMEVLRNNKRTFTVRTDERRRRIVKDNPADAREIFCFGDSSIWGQSLSEGESIPDQLVRLSRIDHSPVRVSNYAVPGSSSLFTVQHATKLLPGARPAAVVISTGNNDSTLIFPSFPRILARFFDRLTNGQGNKYWNLADFLGRFVFLSISERNAPKVHALTVDQYQENLLTIAQLAKNEGALLVIVANDTQATKMMAIGIEDPYLDAAFEVANQKPHVGVVHMGGLKRTFIPLARTAPVFEPERERIRATYIDKVLDPDSLYWTTTDGGHPNPILAEILAWEILAELHRLGPDRFPEPMTPAWETGGLVVRD